MQLNEQRYNDCVCRLSVTVSETRDHQLLKDGLFGLTVYGFQFMATWLCCLGSMVAMRTCGRGRWSPHGG
jgi:hypothetical protein